MRVGLVAVVCGLVGLAGCSSGVIGGTSGAGGSQTSGTGVAGAKVTGVVHGGQNPISGAHVYLFAAASGASGAGQAAYGGPGIAASTSNASVSLLNSASTGHSDSVGAYVLTQADGSFTISGDYTCTAGQQVYLYVLGGDPGLGTGVNAAAGLMAVLGSCPAGGNFLSGTSPVTYVVVNEVSTVAAAYAMAGFATDATHVGSSGTPLALTGIANAFANAANLETIGTGAALSTTPAGNGTVPQAEINTLADVLAACVNSNGVATGPTNATACYTLFYNATSNGASNGTIPADTATAAINIAHNPGANVAALYGLASGTPPFGSGLTAQPNDFMMAVQLSGGGLGWSYGVAIDSLGNAWVATESNLSEFSSAGAALSPSGVPAGDFSLVAVDASGNVWVMTGGGGGGGVTELSGSGSVLRSLTGSASPPDFLGCIDGDPSGIAIDASGNVWLVSGEYSSNTCLVKVSSTGSLFSVVSGSPYDGLSSPNSVAVDGSGNAWVANSGGWDSEFSSNGTPLSGANGYSDTSLYGFGGIALDAAGNAWTAAGQGLTGQHSLIEISNGGSYISGANGYTGGGLSLPIEIAIDGAGNVWVANAGDPYSVSEVFGSVSEFSNVGLPLSGVNGYMGASFRNFPGAISYPYDLAIDGSGDVWVTNQQPYQPFVAEFIGAAVPVITPIVAGLPATPTVDGSSNLGTRP